MKNIGLKQTGQNLAVTIDGVTYGKRVVEADKRESLKAKVVKYNEKNDSKIEKELLDYFGAKTKTKAEVKEKLKKVVEEKEKAIEEPKKEKVLSVDEKDALEKETQKAKEQLEESKKVSAPKEVAYGTPRRGEYR